MDANGNETVTISEASTAGGIENLAFILNDQENTADNGLTATLTKFYGSNITVTQKATTATDSVKNSNYDPALCIKMLRQLTRLAPRVHRL